MCLARADPNRRDRRQGRTGPIDGGWACHLRHQRPSSPAHRAGGADRRRDRPCGRAGCRVPWGPWAPPSCLAPLGWSPCWPTLRLVVKAVDAVAVSDGWLVYRRRSGRNAASLIALRLAEPSRRRHLAGPRPVGQLGRPALDGSRVAFAVDTPRRSRIVLANLGDGARHTLRRSERGTALFNPALLDGRLLYERVSACGQQLRLGSLHSSHGERVLRRLPSTVRRDPGYEAGYEHAWNTASKCPSRGFGRGERGNLARSPSALHWFFSRRS